MARKNRSYFFDRLPEKNRFVKGDRPTEETFKLFSESVGFITDPLDTAKELEQGYVRLAISEDVKNYVVPNDGYSHAVQADQLPEVNASTQIPPSGNPDVPVNAIQVTKDVGSIARRANFLVKLQDGFINWLVKRLVPLGGINGQLLMKTDNVNQSYNYSWKAISDIPDARKVFNKLEPIGTIKMIGGATALASFNISTGIGSGEWEGWGICDGQNGRVNMSGRFPIGYGPGYGINTDGGEAQVTLNVNQIPQHTHDYYDIYFSEAWGTVGNNLAGNKGDSDTDNKGYQMRRTSEGINASVTNQSHNNIPPYRSVLFVQKIS